MAVEEILERHGDSIFANKLPPGLESLTVRSCSRLILSHLRYCCDQRAESLPKLERFSLLERPGSYEFQHDDETLPYIVSSFSAIGVHVETWPLDLDNPPHSSEVGRDWSDA